MSHKSKLRQFLIEKFSGANVGARHADRPWFLWNYRNISIFILPESGFLFSQFRIPIFLNRQEVRSSRVDRRERNCNLFTGSGRAFSGFGIWPKYSAGIGKTITILTGSGIWLFPGKRDLPKIGHGMRDLCLRVSREYRKTSRPTGSSSQSESTRRALSGVSFQTKHPMECLVNRS